MNRKTIRIDELLARIELTSRAVSSTKPELFIAALCGTLEGDYPELARAVATGAGMSHLYPDEVKS